MLSIASARHVFENRSSVLHICKFLLRSFAGLNKREGSSASSGLFRALMGDFNDADFFQTSLSPLMSVAHPIAKRHIAFVKQIQSHVEEQRTFIQECILALRPFHRNITEVQCTILKIAHSCLKPKRDGVNIVETAQCAAVILPRRKAVKFDYRATIAQWK